MAPKELTDFPDFLDKPAWEVAPRLLGCMIERQTSHGKIRIKIVETEAYDQTDVASHSFGGETQRTKVMFGPSGFLYVYFTYGMHYCANIVTGPVGHGSAVLIRAGELMVGSDIAWRYRKTSKMVDATNGPAKLCQATDINLAFNGHDLKKEPIRLIDGHVGSAKIVTTTRIGISKGIDVPWRFFIKDNPYVSKKA